MDSSKQITLAEFLSQHTHQAELVRDAGHDRLECYACGHRCKIGKGKEGICHVRFNRDGKLHAPWGYVAGLHLDPIEKKPFFHAMPGSFAMSFGMLGCDFHCSYCQNWLSSQVLRDPDAVSLPEFVTPEDIVMLAHKRGAKIITSTYNEPLITSEWAVEVFKIAKRYGLLTSYVSNGNGTPEVLEYLRPWLDMFKVDLKCYNDRNYRKLGGVLKNVLDTIRALFEKKFWVEVVTLVVPGFNDSEGELKEIADFLVSVSRDIPWHVTAFHSDYKMAEVRNTPQQKLLRAAEIGLEAGLHFVYAGNLPGNVRRYENTYCPACGDLLVERQGYKIIGSMLQEGICPKCSAQIPGIWKLPKS